jgi:hypothetical protein
MTGERRRKPRLKLCCEIQLRSPDGQSVIRTQTQDLSSEGFYCTSDEPFAPGQWLQCDLALSAITPGSDRGVVIHRLVKVVRVEIKGLDPGFGIACQFERPVSPSLGC